MNDRYDPNLRAEESLEHLVRFHWCNDEYLDDALQRSAIVVALKLTLWRKYPKFYRMNLMRTISGAWIELCAFASYERGKFFLNFGKRSLSKLGCKEIFM